MIIEYKVEKNNININDYLLEKHFSKKLISALKYQGGEILVFDEQKSVNYVLKENDILTIKLPKEEINENILKKPMNLDIIFEDDYILVINKIAGIPTIPSKRHFNNSLANGIANYFFEKNINSNLHFINRLDKDTSGLLIIAKNRFIHHLFANYVKVEKKYLALVSGVVTEDAIIETYIKRESAESTRRIVSLEGEYAKTEMRVIKQYTDYSLVELSLFTGRTHQIRVHMAHLNHPLLGDALYGGNQERINHQALHSYYLKFIHPLTKQVYKFEKAPPISMGNLI